MDKLKHWVKNVFTQNWVKTTQHFLECMHNATNPKPNIIP